MRLATAVSPITLSCIKQSLVWQGVDCVAEQLSFISGETTMSESGIHAVDKQAHRQSGEKLHDSHGGGHRPSDPTVCPECRVVYTRGRWQWLDTGPDDAHEERCPACQQIHDKAVAGELLLEGDFFVQHRDEIISLVSHRVDEQCAQHPLKRIVEIVEEAPGRVRIGFTDRHLPEGVGHAIRKAYKGRLDIQYNGDAGIARASWQR